MNTADSYLKSKAESVNLALSQSLPVSPAPEVIEAMRYSLEAGGKRLRPVLTLATAETLGADSAKLMPVALAIEMIHTYSLIHDDLPAMDDSELRRGKSTCHLAHGEAIAILAGDALLTLSFQLVAQYGLEQAAEKRALQIIDELAAASGTNGMIGGQVLDLQAEGQKLNADQLSKMHALKTGALLTAAVRCGAIAAGATGEELEALSTYASRLGLAFQIVDDILDCSGSVEMLGKTPGDDQAHQKATYPAVLGLEQSRFKADRLYREALEALAKIELQTDILESLAAKLVFRDR